MDLLNNEPVARKRLTVFIIVDVSRSMRGNKLRTVNSVMREVMPELRNLGGSDASVDIAAMSFSDGFEWMYPQPVSIDEFEWRDLEAGGWTSLGAACLELNRVMARDGFLCSPSLSFAPVVILLSDGGPTDKFDSAMHVLNGNKWFKHSLKVAFAIGAKAKLEKLSMFTGDPDTVIRADNVESLSRLLKLVTVRSSEIGSRGTTMSDADPDKVKQRELVDAIKAAVDPSDLDLDEGW